MVKQRCKTYLQMMIYWRVDHQPEKVARKMGLKIVAEVGAVKTKSNFRTILSLHSSRETRTAMMTRNIKRKLISLRLMSRS